MVAGSERCICKGILDWNLDEQDAENDVESGVQCRELAFLVIALGNETLQGVTTPASGRTEIDGMVQIE